MSTYTMGTAEMVAHMQRELPEKYDMSLNREDMATLITVLAAQVGFIDIPEDVQDGAVSLFSSIAETLGVEGV